MATNDIHDELYPNFVCGNREIVFAPNLLQLIKETTSKNPVYHKLHIFSFFWYYNEICLVAMATLGITNSICSQYRVT